MAIGLSEGVKIDGSIAAILAVKSNRWPSRVRAVCSEVNRIVVGRFRFLHA